MSDDLLDRLSGGLRPVGRHVVTHRLLAGALGGTIVSALLLVLALGLRPDLGAAVAGRMFWVKLAYTLAIAVVAGGVCGRVLRPGGTGNRQLSWLAAPVLLMAALAGWQFGHAPVQARMPMVMGHTARVCPALILLASLPPLAGLVWAARGLAPTRLRLAGAAIGLAAGGAGATAYAMHCDESAAAFLLVWYTLGIVLSGIVGAVAGPRLLRW